MKGSVIVHHKKYNKYNISNMETFELINICPSNSRYVVNPIWETEWNLSKKLLGECFPACAPVSRNQCGQVMSLLPFYPRQRSMIAWASSDI